MKKRVFSVVVALALCLGLLPAPAWAVEADPDPQELELNVGNLPAGTQMIFIKNNTVMTLDGDGEQIGEAQTFSYLTLTGKAQGIGITVNADSADTVVELTFRNLDITSPADNAYVKPLEVMGGTVDIEVAGNVSLSAPQMAISVGDGRTTPTVSLAGSGSLTVRQTQGSMDCGMIEHNSASPLTISIRGDVRMEAPKGYLFDNKRGSDIYPISIDAGNITLLDKTDSPSLDGVTLVSSGTLSINGQTPAAQMEKDGATTYLFAGDLDSAFGANSGNDGATFTLLNDVTRTKTLMIYISCTLDLGGRTIRNTNYHCIYIGGTADVTIRGEGEVISEGGHALYAGVKTTLEGGTFTSRNRASCGVCIREAESVLIVRGDVVMRNTAGNYGLGIYSAKSVLLSGGTYSGGEAAIWIDSTSSNSLTLADLLASGYAYHSGDTPIPLPEGKVLTGDVTVELCRHNGDVATYAPIEEENRHSISCSACGKTNGTGNCILENPVPDGETNHKGVCRCGREMTEKHHIEGYVRWSGYSEELVAYKSVTFCQGCWACGYVVPGSEQGTYTITPDFSVTAGQTKGRTLAVTCEPEEALEEAEFVWTNGAEGTEGPEFALPEDLAAGIHNYFVTVIQGQISMNLYVTVTVTQPSGGGGGGGYVPPTPPVSTGTTTEGGTPTTETTAVPTASVSGGKATATVDTSTGGEIVKQAVANKSETVVIAPKVTGSVTKAEVSIPASTVGQIGSQTSASLTVSTPVADVTIPNGGLGSLGSAGGTVTVAAEQTGNTVELTVTAGGRAVESVPGGVTLTVPAANTTPGTVAVLVHGDGTREVVRKSVAVDGSITIPLDGSAKLEIVDNSKRFDDVPATGWKAEAAAFVSSHELFNGTAPGKFSPDAPMSRGMLAVVLHNLENNPAQALTVAFVDVDNSQWYAEGVAWAEAQGIIGGYGNGRFGPNDSVTREQLAVMLWRYAGSPAATDRELRFADAYKASGWALEALRWATENGIINGKGDGTLDPTGQATRAETARMLMNFMEKR